MAISTGRIFPTQTIEVDAGVTSMNIATLRYPGQLGQFLEKDGKLYQVVLVKSTSANLANGTVVMWSDYDDMTVSSVVADAKRNHVAGVGLGTVTAGNYGFIQVAGPHSAVVSTGTFANGDAVIMSATDGTCGVVAAGTAPTYALLGFATAADSANKVATQIRVALNC